MKHILDVYITTYNRSNLLNKAIDSVLNQSYSDFNLYIYDNASTDNTKEVVSSYNDNRLNYIKHKRNIGGLNNIKLAFNNCNSKYIIVLHDDDIVKKDLLLNEISYLENNHDVVAVSCDADIIDEQDNIISDYKYFNNNNKFNCVQNYFENYINTGKTLCFPTIMYRNKFIKENKITLNEEVGPCADVVFLSDIELLNGKIVIIGDKLINYRKHRMQDSSISLVSMTISLFKYLFTNNYYSTKLLNLERGQKRIYRFIAKNIIKNYLTNKVDYNLTVSYLNEISLLLNHSKIDKLLYAFLINICYKCTSLVCKIFNKYTKLRGREWI